MIKHKASCWRMDQDFDLLFEALSKIGTEKRFQSHKDLVYFGERVNKIYLIKEGGLILKHVHPETAKERAINFFIPSFHPIATVSHAYVLNEPSKYRLKTFTNTTLIEINQPELNNFLENSDLAAAFQNHGVKTMIEKNELRANLISLSSGEMFRHLHANFPQILQQVPSKYIADFLGITPQWLSKLKHSL